MAALQLSFAICLTVTIAVLATAAVGNKESTNEPPHLRQYWKSDSTNSINGPTTICYSQFRHEDNGFSFKAQVEGSTDGFVFELFLSVTFFLGFIWFGITLFSPFAPWILAAIFLFLEMRKAARPRRGRNL